MTFVMTLSGEIYLDKIFPLLETKRVKLPTPKRHNNRCRIPNCPIPGCILSARFRGISRGVICSKSKSYFRNSIAILVSTSIKNIHLKLSHKKVQMCGATSVAVGREAIGHVIKQLEEIQAMLDYLHEDPNRTDQTLEWFKEATKGQPVTLDASDESDALTVHAIQVPEEYPDWVDRRITDFFLKRAIDYNQHEIYCHYIDWALTIDRIMDLESTQQSGLEVTKIQKAMVNYNYDLGFDINRWALYRNLDGYGEFRARYQNAIDHCVTVTLPYKPNEQTICKKKKRPQHTFLVYRSGLVTQSGPNEDLMHGAYYKFIEAIETLQPHIVKPTKYRMIKYCPCEIPPELDILESDALDDSSDASDEELPLT